MSLYRLAVFVNRPLVRVLFRPEVRGDEHIPARGGFVVAANHLSGFDIWAVGYPLSKYRLRNMAKNELFKRRFLGPMVRSLGAFPAHDEGPVGGVEEAVGLARAGEVVVIFPTGARRRLARRGERPHLGAARTALEAGVPLVPVGLRGTDGWRRLARWRIAFGPPIPLEGSSAREATDVLWKQITVLEASLGS
jgi:1-acyl-sn-glycerol-3-phosphate acyltransferase